MADNLGQLYDPPFFQAQSPNSLQSARVALPELFRHIRPKNVVDVGCGVGAWLCAAGELGVVECLGIDGGYVDRGALLIPEEAFVPVDLAAPGLSEAVATRRPGRFDLVMCLEVAEHLPFERSAGFVEELCQLGDMVLFSAAIPFQYGTGHINEQWPEFWAMQFRARGYVCFDLMRAFLWAQPELDWWYAQNLLVFAREGSAAHGRLPSAAAAGNRALSLVHPKAWLSSILNHWRPHRAAARQEEMKDLGALLRAWVGNAAMPPQLCATERARVAPPDARNVFPFTRTEIASPEHLIAEAQASLAAAEERVATGERELAATRSELAQAQTEAAAIREELAQAQAEAAEVREELAREQTEAAAIREELAARQIVIESLHAAMEQSRAAETALKAELHGLHSRAETLRAANTTLRGHVQQRETALAKAAERAKELQDGFARREQELQDGFARREQELQDGFARREQELQDGFARREQELQDGFARREQELQDGFARREQELQDGFARREQELQDELVRLKQKIAQFRSSISWRITKPLRALHRRFGSRRGSGEESDGQAVPPRGMDLKDVSAPLYFRAALTSDAHEKIDAKLAYDMAAMSSKSTFNNWVSLLEEDIRGMLIALTGYAYGREPEKRLPEIREGRKNYARYIVQEAAVTPDDVLVDLGSGCGFGTYWFAQWAKHVHACDISTAFLSFAAKECANVPNISFHQIQSRRLSFLDDVSVDVICSSSVFIHLNLYDIYWYFKEFARVLKPGGRFWIDFANSESLDLSTPNQNGTYFLNHAHEYAQNPAQLAGLMCWNSMESIIRLAKHYGFRAVRTKPGGELLFVAAGGEAAEAAQGGTAHSARATAFSVATPRDAPTGAPAAAR